MSTHITRVAATTTNWILLILLTLLSACGGGGGSAEAPGASRLEVGPQSVLLVGVGATRTLSAQLTDASGAPVSGAVTWSSNNPAAVSVDSAGTVRSLVSAGSARVTASSGALSAAVLVTVAQPVAGAQLIADDQIVSGPTAVDPGAEPAAGNAYEAVLRGTQPLAVGTILIASEAANVAGRVVSVVPEGAHQRVRLVVVPLKQLFTAFDFQDTVDLTQGSIETPPELAALYDIAQTGNTFVFTPKPGVLPSATTRERASAAAGTRALPPFNGCEVSPSDLPLPLALGLAPAFELTIDGTVDRRANSQGVRYIVSGKPKFKVNSVLTVTAVFEAKVTCKVTLKVVKFRAPGFAGLFFGGDVEFGVGFEVGGKYTLAGAKVGGSAALNTDLLATLNCPTDADCALSGSSSATTTLTPVLQAPALEQAQFEPSVNLFGFVTLEAGNADIDQLQFKAIELKAGVELAGSVAPEALQMANLSEETGRSKYALAFKGDVGPGIKLGEFLSFVGLSEVVPLKLAFSLELGNSPSAISVVADKASYLPGERASVTVKLTPASTLFPSGFFYNVHRVLLMRKTGLFTTEVLASQPAADAQTDFTLGFDSAVLINAGEIFAFVETKLLPSQVPTFELGAAGAPSLGLSAASGFACGITPTGGLKCWGDNNFGQLGNGTTTDSSVPVDVIGLTDSVVSVSAGGGQVCAVTASGAALCWGFNGVGQVGTGSTTAINPSPAQVIGLSSGVASVSAGANYTCALTTQGGVKCWGTTNLDRLGNVTTPSDLVPVDVPGLTNGVAAISVGGNHACALTTLGGVKCWGSNDFGQLGNGAILDSLVPVDVTGLTSGVAAVTTGNGHSCALTTSGGVKCWGPKLTNGTSTDSSVPVDVAGLSTGVASVAAGEQTCVVTTAGGVKCWGSNRLGALGNGSTTNSSVPVDVTGLSSGAKTVDVGSGSSCVGDITGAVKCWGGNGLGQLGNGTTTNSNVPVAVLNFP